jgi:hypothetical protein
LVNWKAGQAQLGKQLPLYFITLIIWLLQVAVVGLTLQTLLVAVAVQVVY